MHDNRKLPGDSHRSAFEAQPLAQLQPPAPETAFVAGSGSREEDRCRFIQQSPQMAVASSRDVAVIVDLT